MFRLFPESSGLANGGTSRAWNVGSASLRTSCVWSSYEERWDFQLRNQFVVVVVEFEDTRAVDAEVRPLKNGEEVGRTRTDNRGKVARPSRGHVRSQQLGRIRGSGGEGEVRWLKPLSARL